MARFSTANSCPLDHHTTASGTLMCCSFGSVTVSERAYPGYSCRSPRSIRGPRSECRTPPPPLRLPWSRGHDPFTLPNALLWGTVGAPLPQDRVDDILHDLHHDLQHAYYLYQCRIDYHPSPSFLPRREGVDMVTTAWTFPIVTCLVAVVQFFAD